MRRLLIRPGALGDFLVSLPALQFLQSDYTEVWCAAPNVPLARFAAAAYSIGSTGLDSVGILDAPGVMRRLATFDQIHSWYGAARPDFRDAVAHLPFSFYPALPPPAGEHATAFFCRQVGAPVTLPSIPVPLSARGAFPVIHPFASSPGKRWSLDGFRQVAAQLDDVRWCAGPSESLPEAVRIPDLYDLALWLAQAGVYLGNDSGVTHLAAAVGTPVVALFGPSDPAVWAPRGPAVRVISRMPIESISPAEVLAAVRTLANF